MVQIFPCRWWSSCLPRTAEASLTDASAVLNLVWCWPSDAHSYRECISTKPGSFFFGSFVSVLYRSFSSCWKPCASTLPNEQQFRTRVTNLGVCRLHAEKRFAVFICRCDRHRPFFRVERQLGCGGSCCTVDILIKFVRGVVTVCSGPAGSFFWPVVRKNRCCL